MKPCVAKAALGAQDCIKAKNEVMTVKEKDKVKPISFRAQQSSMKLDKFFLSEDKEEELKEE
ncbi:hypothetical protein HY488_00295 [Candidatus Woesearchaeota archaeon]|nr:hypothetical protein [Candidatus Woesearchaeota archaeon]